MSEYKIQIDSFMEELIIKNGSEPEFIQAVEEVVETVIPFIEANPKYKTAKILECANIFYVFSKLYSIILSQS